jgi:predicted RNA binding protein with dsRBD fold (UPF0201 family)
MVDQRLRLSGVGEGFSVQVSTQLRGADSPAQIKEALLNVFPEVGRIPEHLEPSFGSAIDETWSFDDVSLKTFLHLLHEQRILDTALDTMASGLSENKTEFSIGRLAALAGKIAFPIPGETPLGGVFHVAVEGSGIGDWLQAATWHPGRSQVPRSINDERAMEDDGEASTWL